MAVSPVDRLAQTDQQAEFVRDLLLFLRDPANHATVLGLEDEYELQARRSLEASERAIARLQEIQAAEMEMLCKEQIDPETVEAMGWDHLKSMEKLENSFFAESTQIFNAHLARFVAVIREYVAARQADDRRAQEPPKDDKAPKSDVEAMVRPFADNGRCKDVFLESGLAACMSSTTKKTKPWLLSHVMNMTQLGSVIEGAWVGYLPQGLSLMVQGDQAGASSQCQALVDAGPSCSVQVFLGAQLKVPFAVDFHMLNGGICGFLRPTHQRDRIAQLQQVFQDSIVAVAIPLQNSDCQYLRDHTRVCGRDGALVTGKVSGMLREITRTCEGSVDLLFPRFTDQLHSAVVSREHSSAQQRIPAATNLHHQNTPTNDNTEKDQASSLEAELGSVFETMHSNLQAAQLLYHIVVEATEDTAQQTPTDSQENQDTGDPNPKHRDPASNMARKQAWTQGPALASGVREGLQRAIVEAHRNGVKCLIIPLRPWVAGLSESQLRAYGANDQGHRVRMALPPKKVEALLKTVKSGLVLAAQDYSGRASLERVVFCATAFQPAQNEQANQLRYHVDDIARADQVVVDKFQGLLKKTF